jgi:hypothetical protein
MRPLVPQSRADRGDIAAMKTSKRAMDLFSLLTALSCSDRDFARSFHPLEKASGSYYIRCESSIVQRAAIKIDTL